MISHPVRAAAVAVATIITGGVLAAVPAQADPIVSGKVTANGGVRDRGLPTTSSPSRGILPKGERVEIVCKIKGSAVDGNRVWYQLPPVGNEWVSARYVALVGPAPQWCGSTARWAGKTTTAVTQRVAPTTAAARVGVLARGTRVQIVCKLRSQRIDGNDRWYYLSNGHWVAARYVDNVGAGYPPFCGH